MGVVVVLELVAGVSGSSLVPGSGDLDGDRGGAVASDNVEETAEFAVVVPDLVAGVSRSSLARDSGDFDDDRGDAVASDDVEETAKFAVVVLDLVAGVAGSSLVPGSGDLDGDRGDAVASDNVEETVEFAVAFGNGGAPKSGAANRFGVPLDGAGGVSTASRGENVGGLLSAASRSVMERWKGEGRSSASMLSLRGVARGAGEGSRVSFLDGELPILLANSSTTGCVSLIPGCDALLRRPPGLPGGLSVASPDPGRGLFGMLVIPTALLAGLGFRLVRALPLPRFKQSSKQSSQHGLPSTSTIGLVPISLPHPSHLKHLECQTLPEFSTNPPSALSRRTSRPQL